MATLLYSLAAMVMWGIWCYLPRFTAGRGIDASSAIFWGWCGMSVVAALCFLHVHGKPQTGTHGKEFVWSIVTGICGVVGAYLYYLAMCRASSGQTIVVITLSALYPMVGALLALFIDREPLLARQWLGMAICIVGVLLLAPPRKQSETDAAGTETASQ